MRIQATLSLPLFPVLTEYKATHVLALMRDVQCNVQQKNTFRKYRSCKCVLLEAITFSTKDLPTSVQQ